MNNAPAILKSAIIYLICVPLAIWLGYLLTSPMDRTTFSSIGVLALLLALPILLRWHHLLLILCWNLPMMIFFLPGRPMVALPMIAMSFTLAILQRALSRDMRFISVPALTWPMLFMAAVVFTTGKLTGGFGLHSLGSDVMGGKKYAYVFIAILGYFALTSQRIPPRKAWLYIVLFFLPGCLSSIGDLAGKLPSSFNFIFQFFPANGFNMASENSANQNPTDVGMRLSGVMHLAGTFSLLLLIRYGLRGIFLSGRLWRPLLFFACQFLGLAGGFRNALIGTVLLMGILFFLEDLQRTKLLPLSIVGVVLAAMILIPFANKLPYGFQRTLSFLPINVSAEARMNAEQSTEWRLQIWRAVLPQVPGYLLLGKGYALNQSDLDYMGGNFKTIDAANYGSAVAGDYHSGPLSVVIPLGIWGVIAYFWMVIGGGRVLYNNYRYGDPALRTINTYYLASFITTVIFFIFVVGALSSDMLNYAGLFGLSVSLNGGMCRRPAVAPAKVPDKAGTFLPARPGFQPFYPR
jgi:hypothetical protein